MKIELIQRLKYRTRKNICYFVCLFSFICIFLKYTIYFISAVLQGKYNIQGLGFIRKLTPYLRFLDIKSSFR